jgi:hypothetical protein
MMMVMKAMMAMIATWLIRSEDDDDNGREGFLLAWLKSKGGRGWYDSMLLFFLNKIICFAHAK